MYKRQLIGSQLHAGLFEHEPRRHAGIAVVVLVAVVQDVYKRQVLVVLLRHPVGQADTAAVTGIRVFTAGFQIAARVSKSSIQRSAGCVVVLAFQAEVRGVDDLCVVGACLLYTSHPAILQKLAETNFEKVPGYGTDPYCASAKAKI